MIDVVALLARVLASLVIDPAAILTVLLAVLLEFLDENVLSFFILSNQSLSSSCRRVYSA